MLYFCFVLSLNICVENNINKINKKELIKNPFKVLKDILFEKNINLIKTIN